VIFSPVNQSAVAKKLLTSASLAVTTPKEAQKQADKTGTDSTDDSTTGPSTEVSDAEVEDLSAEKSSELKVKERPKNKFQDGDYYHRSRNSTPSPSGQEDERQRSRWSQWLIWMLLLLVLGFFLFPSLFSSDDRRAVAFDDFLTQAEQGNVSSVEINNNNGDIKGEFTDGEDFKTTGPLELSQDDRDIINNIGQVRFTTPTSSFWANLLQILLPVSLLILFFWWMTRRTQGQMKGIMSIGRSKAKTYSTERPGTTFDDIAGYEGVKKDITEIVDFLKEPAKFAKVGAKVPKGVLLVGPPGTGKTLIARAVAGEAGVPFLSVTRSDLMEMCVGVGASRVRDLFQSARKMGRAIIFVDEIDSIGRKRGAGLGGGHDEREQTLNQLLVEMDGFEGNEGIIVIAATNRPDVLDPALLRPGRFDRQVVVPLPDIRGREQILKVHSRKVQAAKNVKLISIARGTPGFSGADLANLVNEAALMAARANKSKVAMADFESAKDKIMMGAERRSMVMGEKEKLLTAYHESGHAIVGRRVPAHDPVYKVTIIPRGRALGVTMFVPENDRLSYTKEYLESRISSLFGGRLAEQIIFGEDHITTGASNDIKQATELARNMVTKWGLSDRMGPLTYGEEENEVFLGHSVAQHKAISDETAHVIDQEIRHIIDRNYQRAEHILHEDIDKLHRMADALMKSETIESEQIDDIMAGREPRPPRDWSGDDDVDDVAAPSREEQPRDPRDEGMVPPLKDSVGTA